MSTEPVPCDRCETVRPGFCPRCSYLMENMKRWRKVAEHEHGIYCQARGDCSRHIEQIYEQFRNRPESETES